MMSYYMRLVDKQFPLHYGDIEAYMRDKGGMSRYKEHFVPVVVNPPQNVLPTQYSVFIEPIEIDGVWHAQWEIIDKSDEMLELEKEAKKRQMERFPHDQRLEASGSVPDVID